MQGGRGRQRRELALLPQVVREGFMEEESFSVEFEARVSCRQKQEEQALWDVNVCPGGRTPFPVTKAEVTG